MRHNTGHAIQHISLVRQGLKRQLLLLFYMHLCISCTNYKVSHVKEAGYLIQRDFGELLASQHDIDTSAILLQHEHDWYESTFLTLEDSVYRSYIVQSLRYQLENKHGIRASYDLLYKSYELPDSTTEKLKSNYLDLIEGNIIDQSVINGYNHNWTDCTNDVIIYRTAVTKDTVSFHCLKNQNLQIENIRKASQLLDNLTNNINYEIYRNEFIDLLPKGKTYNRGMINVYIWKDAALKDWNESYPKRQYQHRISDSITNLLQNDLNELWLMQSSQSRSDAENDCYESFVVIYNRREGKWKVMKPLGDIDVDPDYRSCRKYLNRLVGLYKPKYQLIYSEVRTVDIYEDHIDVTDNNYYGAFD